MVKQFHYVVLLKFLDVAKSEEAQRNSLTVSVSDEIDGVLWSNLVAIV